MRKYELLDQCRLVDHKLATLRNSDMIPLHRIQAIKDFNNVKAGDLGGWVESEENLSQDGNCWVYDMACVFDGALVCGNAVVMEDVWIIHSIIGGSASLVGKHINIVNISLDYGIWDKVIRINGKLFLLSTTLEKIQLYE